MSASLDLFIRRPGAHALRDEDLAVRVLLIEDSLDCASLLERSLISAERGRFSVTHCARLEDVGHRVEASEADVVIVDVALAGCDERMTIEAADALSQRLPVIVLTGTQDGALEHSAELNGSDDVCLLSRLERAALPARILEAIRRHRRIGPSGMDPIVCRVPAG